MITDAALPDWPPPPDEPIGLERARAYIAWVRCHAPPLIAEPRRRIDLRYPGCPAHTYAVTVDQLATWSFSDRLQRLSIGDVISEPTPGGFAIMSVSIRRDGRLELRPGLRIRD